MAKSKTCKTNGCKANAHCRGHCASHYETFRRRVAETAVTWNQLELLGLVERPYGRTAAADVDAAIAAATTDEA